MSLESVSKSGRHFCTNKRLDNVTNCLIFVAMNFQLRTTGVLSARPRDILNTVSYFVTCSTGMGQEIYMPKHTYQTRTLGATKIRVPPSFRTNQLNLSNLTLQI
ncbi:hypothetical protein IscW_ISCW010215 [Ixodes scapularis]|uniref:Uncharacterized protein n=1 Tax=Ixodes scapularis TaxID=6945 RepID=B7Q0R7_IXOSC|nr:hypothetical protein IscW_ISCW010215 [Ixodes scapularis]|eukprot:XP_002408278.1 hypothetical protein IscW_ISCW010215 [Ixodes scapularis]